MATQDMSDPFQWDVNAVCKHLCATGSPWTNNIEALEDQIRHEDIDGETLLTTEITMSRQELMEFLGLRTAKHKSKMALEIKRLRAASDGFNAWKKQNESFIDEDVQKKNEVRRDEPERARSPIPESSSLPPKRRRIMPTLVGTLGISPYQSSFENEKFNVPDPHSAPITGASPSTENVQPSLPSDEQLPDGVKSQPLYNFSFCSGEKISRIHRRSMYRQTMSSMRKHQKRQDLMKRGEVARESCHSQSPSEQFEDDEVKDLDEMDVELDEQTQREMEEERAEEEDRLLRMQKKNEAHHLDPDDVRQILENVQVDMRKKWNEAKRLKAEHAALRTWDLARVNPKSREPELKAQRDCRMFEKQLAKSCNEIVKGEWTKESDVRNQAKMLETAVANSMRANVILATLKQRDRPSTPPPVPKSQPKLRHTGIDADEDMSIGSSDDEELFIEPSPKGHIEIQPNEGGPTPMNIAPLEEGLAVNLITPNEMSHHKDNHMPINSVEEIEKTKPRRKTFALCPSLQEPESFSKVASEKPIFWVKKRDRWRLVISLLSRIRYTEREELFEICRSSNHDAVWDATLEYVLARCSKKKWKGISEEQDRVPVNMTSIFWSFWKCKIFRPTRIKSLPRKSREKVEAVKTTLFKQFHDLLPNLKPRFPGNDLVLDYEGLLGGLDDIEEDEEERHISKKSGKEIFQDAKAKEMREKDHQRAKELEDKKLKLRAQLGQTGVMPLDRSKIIINESKRDDQAVIYINRYIGSKIKLHQLNGVRFLWNQIVTDADEGQGCLLSHTMGLGKTMQAIALLVTIQECVKSEDAAIRNQIPRDLKASRTIILCPAGLIDNWISEIRHWDEGEVLAPITKIDPQIHHAMRRSSIWAWSNHGGTLIMGYELFVSLESDSEIGNMLTKTPNIVVVDEAHNLKNRQSLKSIACSSFSTSRRVALTGSPLANNVEEYYSMIEWIAPGFLGPIDQFKTFFAGPIHQGLWTDSSNKERRTALRLLEALTQIVAPKVNRASISDFKKDLPEKLEFVISVVPTDMQRKLYSIYMDGLLRDLSSTDKVPQAKAFGALALLGHICNHPQCFREKTLEAKHATASVDGEGELKSYPYAIIPEVLDETKSIRDLDEGLSRKTDFLRIILNDARRKNEKTLVFSQSILTLHYLKRLFTRENRTYSFLDGSTPTAKRQQEVTEFNKKATQIYLISTTAGGVGLNIQSATRVVIFDQRWNPVHEQQAIARAYRMGQKRKVVVYRLITAGTFEEDLQNKAVFKQQLASRVIDQKAPSRWSKQLGNVIHHIRDSAVQDLNGFLGKDSALDKIIGHSMLHSSVQSILSADAFEEEDPTDELTEEEKKHAAKIAEVGRERITEPEKYSGRMQLLLSKYNDVDFSTDNSAALAELEKLIAPQTMLAEEEPYKSPMSPASLAARPKWMQTYPGANKLYLEQPEKDEDTQQDNALRPILGANTFFRGAANSPKLPTVVETLSNGHSNDCDIVSHVQLPTQKTAWAKLTSTSSLNQSSLSNKDAFEKAIMTAFDESKHHLPPEEIDSARRSIKSVTREVAEIRTEQNFGFIYNNRRWKTLTEMVRQHDRLVLAIAMRTVQPSYLATSDERVLQGKIAALSTMSPERFADEFIKGKRVETSEGLQRTPGLRLSDSSLRKVVTPEKLKTRTRLPKWASEALNEHGED